VLVAIENAVRARMATCPSCGGPLRFRGATSIVAVCQYCHATLVREGAKLEDIGKQADLLPDESPIQLGTTGSHRGETFSVVGRIQYRYEAGLWNEWHALFDVGKSGWLADANRDYTITYLSPPGQVPAFAALKPGDTISLLGDRYSVSDIETAEVVAGEGELPFKFRAGWKAPVADLRGSGARFATIDYSEDTPHIYIGERLPFDTFRFAGLRDPDRPMEPGGRALAFKCAGCGAPIEKHVTTSEVVACGSCGSVTDVTKGAGEIVQRHELNMSAYTPSIPVGTTGRWRGARYEVVGYMRRGIRVDGQYYEWGEYLAHNVELGYLWISEYEGHFSVIKAATDIPAAVAPGLITGSRDKPKVRYLGRLFEHFQRSEPEVAFLVGEFYWRVQLGDKCIADDYVAPPLILSSEHTENEITWSIGEYVEPGELWQAFGLKGRPPERKGVAPNQPSPHQGKVLAYWLVCLAFIGIAVVMQFGFMAWNRVTQPALVAFTAAPGQAVRTVSPVFELGGRAGRANLHSTSDAQSEWLDLDMQLVNADTGEAWRLSRQLGVRSLGADWDGTSDDMAEIRRVPPGRYTLAIDARSGSAAAPRTSGAGRQVKGHVRIYRSSVDWSNLFLFAGFLVLWPLIAWARARAFENARWSESDYPPVSASASEEE
jgi:hypothetical protein